MIQIEDPVLIVGDIHGQFYDLLKIIDIGGDPATNKYIFMGDYIDRGYFSLEVLLILISFKINFPKNIVLLRGNHECRQLAETFNFYEEIMHKYDKDIFEAFIQCFQCLPLACILNKKFLIIHGGISPELNSIQQIRNLNRFCEPPKNGLFWFTY